MINLKHKIISILTILALIICNTLIILAEQTNESNNNLINTIEIEGDSTKGIKINTKDIYFDGHLLMLGHSAEAIDEKNFVVEDTLQEHDNFFIENDEYKDRDLKDAIGYLYEVEYSDADGNKIESIINAYGKDDNNNSTKTYVTTFDADSNYEDVIANVTYAMMEEPGKVSSKGINNFQLIIPITNKADKYDVNLDKMPKELSYINRIFVVQSDSVTSVYVYYKSPSISWPKPFEFIDNDNMIKYPNTGSDYEVRSYNDGKLENIEIKDNVENKTYTINLKNGEFSLVE